MSGSVQCYSKWQITMILFGLTYVLPYPLLFYIGMKLIMKKKISKHSFLVACIFPLPLLAYWQLVVARRQYNKKSTSCNISGKMENIICDGIRGGFRKSNFGTQYWESVLMFRRLFISMTILIPNPFIKLSVCFSLCLVCLLHHAFRCPFEYNTSNRAETLSLSLLCGIAAINLFKTSYVYTDTSPGSPQVHVMRNLQLFETMCVVILIVFITLHEIRHTVGTCWKKSVRKKTKIFKISSAIELEPQNQTKAE